MQQLYKLGLKMKGILHHHRVQHLGHLIAEAPAQRMTQISLAYIRRKFFSFYYMMQNGQ